VYFLLIGVILLNKNTKITGNKKAGPTRGPAKSNLINTGKTGIT
jgi:hypothetical protein